MKIFLLLILWIQLARGKQPNHKIKDVLPPLKEVTVCESSFRNKEFDDEVEFNIHPVCNCLEPKIWTIGNCFNNLNEAINSAPTDSVIYIASDIKVIKSIVLLRDVNFYGVNCFELNGHRPKIVNSIHPNNLHLKEAKDPKDAIFELKGLQFQTLRLKNLEFTVDRNKDGSSYFGRAIKADQAEKELWLTLDIRNCYFHDFLTNRRGSAILMSYAHRVSIDQNTLFENNQINGDCDCYEGGTIAAEYIPEFSFIETQATFSNNHARFHYDWINNRSGSEHAEGGAIYVTYVDGLLMIGGKFLNNSGNDGGAISLKTVDQGTVNLNGHFENNMAIDGGAEARGGVLRIFNLSGSLLLTGQYINNSALGNENLTARGGVFAGNYIHSEAVVYVDGVFSGNKADTNGAVISILGSSKGMFLDGKVFVAKTSVFHANTETKKKNIIFIRKVASITENDWTGKDNLMFQQKIKKKI